MKHLRLLLLPFSWIYGLVVFVRNKLYDANVLKSYVIPGKSILVGNLSVGGTGKTPHVDYLIRHFLEKNVKLATLSRGYGRKSSGIRVASRQTSAEEIGDEPLQYFSSHGDKIRVVVAEKRADGVKHIQSTFTDNQLILLDDAFQHRAIKAGLNLLITPYNDLFSDDFLLPAGNLREWRFGKKRADVIIVSKCPKGLSSEEQKRIIRKLGFQEDRIFFSSITYGDLVPICENPISERIEHALVVTGIGNPNPLLEYLTDSVKIEHISFPDHHNFSSKDIVRIHEKFDTFASRNKAIITTEKDFMRLQKFDEIGIEKFQWHYQPITVSIDKQHLFNLLLDEYFGHV